MQLQSTLTVLQKNVFMLTLLNPQNGIMRLRVWKFSVMGTTRIKFLGLLTSLAWQPDGYFQIFHSKSEPSASLTVIGPFTYRSFPTSCSSIVPPPTAAPLSSTPAVMTSATLEIDAATDDCYSAKLKIDWASTLSHRDRSNVKGTNSGVISNLHYKQIGDIGHKMYNSDMPRCCSLKNILYGGLLEFARSQA